MDQTNFYVLIIVNFQSQIPLSKNILKLFFVLIQQLLLVLLEICRDILGPLTFFTELFKFLNVLRILGIQNTVDSRLPGVRDTGDSPLPRIWDTRNLQFPGVPDARELF